MAGPSTTPAKKRKVKSKSYSSGKGKKTKAERKASKSSAAPATPKTSTPRAIKTKKRQRSTSPQKTPPSSAKKRTEPAPIPRAFYLAASVIRKCDTHLWWRVTPDSDESDDICVGSRQAWENVLPVLCHAGLLRTKEVSAGVGKYQLIPIEAKWKEMQQYLEDEHNLVMHMSTYRPRGKRRCGLIQKYICTQVKKTGKGAKNTPRFNGPGGQKAYQSQHPYEPLFAERSSNRATKLSNSLADHRKDVQAAQCQKTYEDLVTKAKTYGFMDLDLLKTLKENGSTSTSKASASSSLSDDELNADASTAASASDAPTDATTNTADDIVKAALNLNFDVRMADNDQLRPPRYGSNVKDPIPIIKEKQATERMRFCAVALADFWGYSDPTRPFEDRQTIARAACSQIAYDHGYRKSTGGSQLYKWRRQMYARLVGGDANPIGRATARGRTAYTDKIEKDEPGYLRELYRYATRMKGAMASFRELADCMSAKSATPDENRMTISLHRLQLFRWWRKQGGKEKSSIEKPRLTPEYCRKRLDWIEKWEDITTDPNIPVAYLDEKWFYTSSRRRKIKTLPLSDEELSSPNLASIHASEASPKIRSRRYPVKVMYLGVVGRPMKDETKDIDFNGRIMIKRVAREQKVGKLTRNQNFSPDAKVNDALKNDKAWRDVYDEDADMTAGHLCDHIAEIYGLSEFVTERLELQYEDYKSDGQAKSRKHTTVDYNQKISDLKRYTPNSNGEKVKVEIDDLELGVRYQEGDKVTKDCSCDSKWMLETMDEVGKAIREKYHWVKWDPRSVQNSDVIHLVMDNAGGHGTDTAVKKYTEDLKNKYKIEIVQQVPRSPETNVLDLGIWMSLQSAVEKEHRGQKNDANALDKTVMKVWADVASKDAFLNVFGKLPVIYNNIKRSRGGNNLVETRRGKAGLAKIAEEEAEEDCEPLWPIDAPGEDDDIEDDIDENDEDDGVIDLL